MLADGELALAQGNGAGSVERMDALLAYLHKISTRPFVCDALFLNWPIPSTTRRF